MTRLTKTTLNTATSLAVLMLLAPLAQAQTSTQSGPTTGSGRWYYEVGGAEPVSAAPNARVTPITISGSVSLQLPKACSALDPVLSVSNILDDVKNGIDQFEDSLVLAANSAIAALPAIILQRANPGLYDHFQNATLNAQARVNVAVKSCEQIVQDAENGENPFRDWVSISRGFEWNNQLTVDGNDPVSAQTAVDTANGDGGVPWLGGQRGGDGQEPIAVIYDTVMAGYNVTLNRPPAATGSASPAGGGTSTPRLVELWSTPEAASQWAREVLGDYNIRTCQGCVPDTVPGVGLLPKYELEKDAIVTELSAIVQGGTPPTLANLSAVSAPQVVITRQVIDALRNTREDQERGLLINRLAADAAAARTIERALTIRRLIVTGKKVPEISASGAAIEENLNAVEIVQQEIDNFLYEDRIRRELISRTPELVLMRDQARTNRSLDIPSAIEQDPDAIRDGKVERP